LCLDGQMLNSDSRSRLYDPTSLELERVRLLRLRKMQEIPSTLPPISKAFSVSYILIQCTMTDLKFGSSNSRDDEVNSSDDEIDSSDDGADSSVDLHSE
jgi:hypothetical protein